VTAAATGLTVTLNAISQKMTFVPKNGGEAVATGEPTSSHKYEFSCDPGDYIVNLFDAAGVPTGSIVANVNGDTQELKIFNVYASATNGGWILGEDYDIPFDKISVKIRTGGLREITPVKYKKSGKDVVTFPAFNGDSYSATYIPLGEYAEDFAPAEKSGTVTMNVNATQELSVYKEFSIIVPKDADLFVGRKPGAIHYVPFIAITPQSAVESGDNMVYTFREASGQYNYRVTRDGSITNAAIFNSADGDIVVTDAQLNAYTPHYYNHDVALNNGYNYADIFLNINPQNHLVLKPGDDFQIVNLRTWQLANSMTANYFIEPDFHYTVLNTDFREDRSVVDVDGNGLLTAKSEGTAIVQVRYDAMAFPAAGGELWSEIWAENVGTFVVTVGGNVASVKSNMILPYTQDNRGAEIDAEHDVFYYLQDEDGFNYTFTPEGAASVTVANPVVDLSANTLSYPSGFSDSNVTRNPDGSYTVKLTFGRNIVRLTDAAGNSVYQVMSAKPVSYMARQAVRSDNYILPGDQVSVRFTGLYHNAGKLAAVYNEKCIVDYAVVPEGVKTSTKEGQYDFASNNQYLPTLPAGQPAATLAFTGGRLLLKGFGDKLGGHRTTINYVDGVSPNFTASMQNQYSGVLPDVSFKTDEFIEGMELSLELLVKKNATPVSVPAVKAFFGEDVVVTSDNPDVATVSAAGKVTAVKEGMATITYANASGSKKITCKVSVQRVKVEGVSFRQPEVLVKTYASKTPATETLNVVWNPSAPTNTNCTVVSSNPEVCDLVEKSKTIIQITPKQGVTGETTITLTTEDGGFTAECHVTIVMGVEGLTLSKETAEMTIGETLVLTADFLPENAYNRTVEWKSADPAIASVDENGVVTAIAEGETVISATSAEDSEITASCAVKVKKAVESGIDAMETIGVKAGPNPFTDHIVVTVPEATTVSIYNLQGAMLLTVGVDADTTTIDTSALPAGLYLVRIGSETVRMIRM